ncbi:MAG: hypothetical protein ACK5RL_03640 [Acidimicrobiales bacterium]
MTAALVPAAGLEIVPEASGGHIVITPDARHVRLSDAALQVLRTAGAGAVSVSDAASAGPGSDSGRPAPPGAADGGPAGGLDPGRIDPGRLDPGRLDPGGLDPGRVARIRGSLVAAGLLVPLGVEPPGVEPPAGVSGANRRLRFRRLTMIRLRLGRAERLVAALAPAWAALARGPVLALGAVPAVLGVLVALRELFTSAGLLRGGAGWSASVAAALATLVIAFLHELGHALELSRRGGRPGGRGVMLMWFLPAAYCDVSDVWRIPDRAGRMAVSAAGPAVNLGIGGILGLIRLAGEDAAWLRLLLMSNLALLAFNASPFLRTDIYWMLAHWLRNPTLLPSARRDAWLVFRPGRRRRNPRFSWARAAYGLGGTVAPVATTVAVWLAGSR